MTNHAFVTTRGRRLTPELVGGLLQEIVRERWGAAVVVEKRAKTNWLIRLSIEDKGIYNHFQLGVWIDTSRKLTFRKGMGDLSSWLQSFMQHTLAFRLNGVCSDEGVSERWDGDPMRYRTFQQWWDSLYEEAVGNDPGRQEFVRGLYQDTVRYLPPGII